MLVEGLAVGGGVAGVGLGVGVGVGVGVGDVQTVTGGQSGWLQTMPSLQIICGQDGYMILQPGGGGVGVAVGLGVAVGGGVTDPPHEFF